MKKVDKGVYKHIKGIMKLCVEKGDYPSHAKQQRSKKRNIAYHMMAENFELMQGLSESREATAAAKIYYEVAKETENAWREAVANKLHAEGLNSAKAKDGTTAYFSERLSIKITHEPSVIAWLKDNPNIEADLYIGLNKTAFDTIAKTVLKETGEIIPGTDIEAGESLSIRKAKEAK